MYLCACCGAPAAGLLSGTPLCAPCAITAMDAIRRNLVPERASPLAKHQNPDRAPVSMDAGWPSVGPVALMVGPLVIYHGVAS